MKEVKQNDVEKNWTKNRNKKQKTEQRRKGGNEENISWKKRNSKIRKINFIFWS